MSTFASFQYPRKLFTLPRGTLAQRLERYKKPKCTGEYYLDNANINPCGKSFYLLSDFMLGLRWQYASESPRVKHKGWFIDSSCTDTVQGIVFRLPHGRGFIPGWTMGESLTSAIDYMIVDDFDDCAMIADHMARQIAEDERMKEYEYEHELD